MTKDSLIVLPYFVIKHFAPASKGICTRWSVTTLLAIGAAARGATLVDVRLAQAYDVDVFCTGFGGGTRVTL
jgi:hypothetical protein